MADKKSSANSVKSVVAESKTFEQGHIDRDKRASRAGFLVGGGGLVIGVMALAALLMLFPLKQTMVELYTVDNHTGESHFVTRVSKTSLTAQEAVEKAKVAFYIKTRERYNYFSLQHDYNTVQVFNSPDVNNEYLAWYAGKNAPDVVYKDAAYIADVEIIGTQITDATAPDRLATVRFRKTIRRVLDNKTDVEYWDVRMTFHFEPDREMKETEREVNEFGMVITSYQRDKEIRGGM